MKSKLNLLKFPDSNRALACLKTVLEEGISSKDHDLAHDVIQQCLAEMANLFGDICSEDIYAQDLHLRIMSIQADLAEFYAPILKDSQDAE